MTQRETQPRETALVTGASSGIGLELARELAANGHSLVLIARNRARLATVAQELRSRYPVSIEDYACDLSEPGAAEALWTTVSKAGRNVDILINNAGVGAYGSLQDQPVDMITGMQMTNMVALTTLTRLALPAMLARRRGRILNVASVVGYQPGGPRMAVYYATKSYVLAFSKGLSRELDGSGVSVTVLSPGVTQSSFEQTAGAGDAVLYRVIPQMTAASVAAAGYRAMMRGRRSVIPGVLTKLMAFSGELPPRGIALEVNRWLLRRRAEGASRSQPPAAHL